MFPATAGHVIPVMAACCACIGGMPPRRVHERTMWRGVCLVIASNLDLIQSVLHGAALLSARCSFSVVFRFVRQTNRATVDEEQEFEDGSMDHIGLNMDLNCGLFDQAPEHVPPKGS